MQHRQQAKWGRMILYMGLLALVVGLMVALSLCDRRPLGPVDHPSGGDTIDVAIEYSPVTYYFYDDTLGGYNYDLLRLMAAHARRPMKFHPIVTLEKALKGLDEKTYDLVVAQYPMTAENRARYLFTEPIYVDQQVLVQRGGNDFKSSQLELAGDTVWVVKGSPMQARIASLSREIGDTIYVIADDRYGPEQLAMRVASGEIKNVVINKSIAQHLTHLIQNIDCSVEISMTQFQSWVLRLDQQTLCDSINAWHQAVMASPEGEKLLLRYFGSTQPWKLAR